MNDFCPRPACPFTDQEGRGRNVYRELLDKLKKVMVASPISKQSWTLYLYTQKKTDKFRSQSPISHRQRHSIQDRPQEKCHASFPIGGITSHQPSGLQSSCLVALLAVQDPQDSEEQIDDVQIQADSGRDLLLDVIVSDNELQVVNTWLTFHQVHG